MEFYFGDANLAKSKFMKELMTTNEDPSKPDPLTNWVDLDIFAKFNKLMDILQKGFDRTDLNDLWKALSKIDSELLEVREVDGKRQVRRGRPFAKRDNEEACTVYVENIPDFMGQDQLTSAFSLFGQVSYVSLPRYKHNRAIKGFAFVEFADEAAVANVLKDFDEKGYVIDDKKLDPGDLQSIRSFQHEEAVSQGLEDPKPVKSVDGGIAESSSSSESEADDAGKKENVEKTTKKRSRKRKRRTKSKGSEGHKADFRSLNLRVLSKRKWKQLRNSYLNQQRKNMSEAKKRLRDWRSNQNQFEESKAKGTSSAAPAAVVSKTAEEVPDIEFKPGTIVKLTVSRADRRPHTDQEAGQGRLHRARGVRRHPSGRLLLPRPLRKRRTGSEIGGNFKSCRICGGFEWQEETDYWDKIRKDRKEKRSGEVKRQKNSRGKDKIVKRLEDVAVSNTHKYFGDE